MTENLKIEVSMVNVEGGVVDTSLATKTELAAAVETKADLIQGKVPVIQLPGFNEISGVSEAINGVETKIREEVETKLSNSNNGLESRIDEKLVLKADLVNGRVPASQSPAFKDVEGAKGALDGLEEALTTKYDQKVVELSEGKADLVDGKIPTSQLPIDGITLPLATTSVSGTVQLNNTLTSTSTGQALTAAQGKVLNDQAFGVGQNWMNVKSERSLGTTYTNTTGKPIYVIVVNEFQNYGDPVEVFVNNIKLLSVDKGVGIGWFGDTSFVVPAGQTYKVTKEAYPNIQSWVELR